MQSLNLLLDDRQTVANHLVKTQYTQIFPTFSSTETHGRHHHRRAVLSARARDSDAARELRARVLELLRLGELAPVGARKARDLDTVMDIDRLIGVGGAAWARRGEAR